MLVRNDFGSGVETRLFIDGTNNGIASSGTPRPPADFFFVAANRIASGPEGHFQGQIDNVVVENASPVFLQPVQVSPTANVSAGGSFTLSAVASGVQPLNFAWRRNGMVVTNTGSAPSAAFVGVSSAQSGDYDVVVTNGFGSSTGQLVSISVTATHTVSPATLTAQMKSDRLEVQCVGTPGATYMLWRTPDLAPAAWINISAGSSDASGKLLLTDPFPPVTGAYYRASALNLKEL
jgi:hypothetical protein